MKKNDNQTPKIYINSISKEINNKCNNDKKDKDNKLYYLA